MEQQIEQFLALGPLALLIFALFIIGPFVAVWGMRIFWKGLLVRNIPTSKIRSASVGFVEVKGVARPQTERQTSPITNRPCAWWCCDIHEIITRGGDNENCFLKSVGIDSPFFLEDLTGKILVDPRKAELKMARPDEICWTKEKSDLFKNIIKKWDIKDFTHIEDLVIREFIIPAFQPLYVMGYLEPAHKGMRPSNQSMYENIRALKNDREAMAEADTNKDGHVDVLEWDEFIKKKQSMAKTEAKNESIRYIIQRSQGRPFIISDKYESSVKIGYFLGGILFVILGCGFGAFFTLLSVKESYPIILPIIGNIFGIIFGLVSIKLVKFIKQFVE